MVAAVVVATVGRSVEADTKAYSTNPADANFSGIDWTAGTAPAATPTTTLATGDSLYFGGAPTYTTLNNDEAAGFDVAGLTFNADAAAFTINGNALNLSGGITSAAANAQVINTALALTASQTITTSGVGPLTLAGAISDGGGGYGLTFTGTGTTIVLGENTYTGPTSVSGPIVLQSGSLTTQGNNYDFVDYAAESGPLGVNSALTLANTAAASITAVNTTLQVGSLSGGGANGGNIAIDNGTFVIGGTNNVSGGAYGGSITGSNGYVFIEHATTTTFTGASTYTGETIITSGATLQLGDGTAGHDGTVAGNRDLVDSGTLVLDRAGNVTDGYTIYGGGGSVINVIGTGTETLSSSTTQYYGALNVSAGTLQLTTGPVGGGGFYSGQTTVSGGTLAFIGDATMGNVAVVGGKVTVAGGTVDVTATGGNTHVDQGGTLEVDAGGTLNVTTGGGSYFPIGDTAGTTSTVLVAGGSVSILNDYGTEVGHGGSANGVLTINAGTFTNNDGNGIGLQIGGGGNGMGTVNLNGGALVANTITSLSGPSLFYFNGGTLRPTASNGGFLNNYGTLTAQVRNGGAVIDTSGFNVTIAQPLLHSTVVGDAAIDGGLTMTGAGTLTLTGNNTYNGPTNISGPVVLQSVSVNSQGNNYDFQDYPAVSGPLGVNSAITLANTAAASITSANYTLQAGSLSGGGPAGGNLNIANGTLIIGGTNNLSGSYGGSITGTNGYVFIEYGGTATLTGASAYTGETIILNGSTLQLGDGTAGHDGTVAANRDMVNSGTLILNRAGAVTDAYVIGGSGGSINVIGTGTETLSGNNQYGGALNVSSGTLNLTGSSAGYYGQTTVSSGTLVYNGSITSGDVYVAGGKAVVAGGTVNVTSDGGNTHVDQGGTLEVDTGGTFNVSGGGSYFPIGDTGGTTSTVVVDGGAINVLNNYGTEVGHSAGANGVLTINAGTYTNNDTAGVGLQVGGDGGGFGTLNLNGGLLVANTITSFDGPSFFNFNGGTLRPTASNPAFFNDFGTLTAQVRNGGAVVDTGGFNVTIAQPLLHSIVGGDNATDGGLTKIGAGTLTLSGVNTYTGPTNISAGTLALSTGGTNPIAASSKILVSAGATLDVTAVSGGFAVASGQTLAGGGTVAGGTTLGTGSTITAGTGATTADVLGHLTTGAQTWTGGTYAVKLDGSHSTAAANGSGGSGSSLPTGTYASDELILSGLSGGSSGLTVNPVLVNTASFTPGTHYSYVIADDTNSTTPSSTTAFDGLLLSSIAVAPTYSLSTASDGTSSGEDLILDFTATAATPEPTSLLLVGAAAAPMVLGRRRQRRQRAVPATKA